jgi:hypothetical protein
VTDWTPVFLGIIAVSVLVMAAIQVGAVIAGARLAQRVNKLADQIQQEVRPLSAHLQTVAAEAARASTLAAQQVERADRLFADVSQRVEETVTLMQEAVVQPARQSMAVMAGFKAVVATLRGLRHQPPRGKAVRQDEEEDSLFIG